MNLYIGNLGFHVSELDLKTLFESYGKVNSAKLIIDRETGNSRGFGFIEMDSNDATRAMEGLQDKEIEGRSIKISIAREKYSVGSKKSW
jgi:RNA recognition motif-containing protein